MEQEQQVEANLQQVQRLAQDVTCGCDGVAKPVYMAG
jgi:hypothetical protein